MNIISQNGKWNGKNSGEQGCLTLSVFGAPYNKCAMQPVTTRGINTKEIKSTITLDQPMPKNTDSDFVRWVNQAALDALVRRQIQELKLADEIDSQLWYK